MKVFSSGDIKFLEKCAVESGVTMEQLMDKAGSAVAAFMKRLGEVSGKSAVIICGKGNNGGDGFVCARKLKAVGANVTVVTAQGNPVTDLAKNAFSKLPAEIRVLPWPDKKFEIEGLIEKADFLVDAVFGFGFRGRLDESLERLSEIYNHARGIKIAADLPSGAQCDTGRVEGQCFKSGYTVSFTGLKPANVLNPATAFCGKNVVAPVGIDKSMVEAFPSAFSVIRESDVKKVLPLRPAQSNKGDFGRLLMLCGSYGMAGACIMAARGALRSGVGLVDIAVHKELYPIIAASVPEAVFTVLDFDSNPGGSGETLFSALKKASAVLIGCGLGADASRYVSTVLKFAECPIVLDADAINYIAKNPEELAAARAPVVLTPHPGEMGRLTGKTALSVQLERYNTAKKFAAEHMVYTVLKGAGTLIAAPDGEMRINVTGNSGMAKGGSGDVLAGVIGALLAQGMEPEEACSAGAYIHGRAGDKCALKFSKTSMLPTDLIEALADVFLELEKTDSVNSVPD